MAAGITELLSTIQPLGLVWDIGIIIIAATLLNFIARALKQPPLVAYIIAGILIGPWGIPLAVKSAFGAEISLLAGEGGTIRLLSELGIAFLLFSVGIESELAKLKKLGFIAFFGSTLQVFLTAAFVLVFASIFHILAPVEALYLGIVLAFSSTMLVVKLLSDNFSIDTMQGRLMVGFLLVQDVIVIVLMPIAWNWEHMLHPSFLSGLLFAGIVLLSIAFFLSRFVYGRIFRFASKDSEMTYLAALSTCFGFMFLSQMLNIPLAIGAFIAGLSLSMLPFNFQISEEIRGIRDFFVSIFFVTLGLQISFAFTPGILLILALAFFTVLVLKPVIFFAITYFAGYGKRVSLLVALGLAQVSEFSFLFASQGLSQGVLSQAFYSVTILVIAVSMLLTPYFMQSSEWFYSRLLWVSERIPEKMKSRKFYRKVDWLEEGKSASNHIVVVGAGVVGGSIARLLNGKQPLLVMEHDPDIVERLKGEKINIFLGESRNRIIWKKLGLEKARLLVITIPNVPAAQKLLEYAKGENKSIVVFARAHSFDEASKLYESGADFVCMPEVAGSNV
ncbi:MAG: cation:proton antiporter, partial [Candidatus Diapherotrites archaeon]|nr:cation:proton antiporter [Candidatus Diapherotrites archaeon]